MEPTHNVLIIVHRKGPPFPFAWSLRKFWDMGVGECPLPAVQGRGCGRRRSGKVKEEEEERKSGYSVG